MSQAKNSTNMPKIHKRSAAVTEALLRSSRGRRHDKSANKGT